MTSRKLLSAFLTVVFLNSVYSKLLQIQNSALKTQSPLFYVSGLINEWNKNKGNKKGAEILVLNIGEKNDFYENVISVIPKDNTVMNVNPEQCNKFKSRYPDFVIITSQIENPVKKSSKLKFSQFFFKCSDQINF